MQTLLRASLGCITYLRYALAAPYMRFLSYSKNISDLLPQDNFSSSMSPPLVIRVYALSVVDRLSNLWPIQPRLIIRLALKQSIIKLWTRRF